MQIIKNIKIYYYHSVAVILVHLAQNQLKNALKELAEQFLILIWHLDDIVLEPLAKGYNKLPIQ